ncbi:MAG: hypothetical protein ACRDYA_16340 [Egibacteraceae bacterium]
MQARFGTKGFRRRATRAAYTSMELLIHPFLPTLAISAFVSGIVLSVGTKWGLFKHYWIVTKLLLNIAVILLGANIVKSLVEQALAATAGAAPELGATGALLVVASSTNLAMLVAATVVSVYKPWGKTRRLGLRRRAATASAPTSSSSRSMISPAIPPPCWSGVPGAVDSRRRDGG